MAKRNSYFSGVGANPTNETSRELNSMRRRRFPSSSAGLYKKYLEDGTAQFLMSFTQWKKKHRKKKHIPLASAGNRSS